MITCLSICRSPMTHMSGVVGNEAVINREPVMTAAGIRFVPVLSGNAIRHRVVRAQAARYLVEKWKMTGLTIEQLNFLFHGGRLSEKGGRINLKQQGELFRLFPMMQLLGCSLPGNVVAGSLYVHRGTLVCRENHDRLRAAIPDDWALPRFLRSAVAYIQPYTYYRSSIQAGQPDLAAATGNEDLPESRMITSGQSVIPGAAFVHGFSIARHNDLILGCLLHSLRLWRDAGATMGGQPQRGHGRLEMFVTPTAGEEELIGAYVDHVATVADEGREFLETLFAAAIDPKDTPDGEAADG